MSEQIDQCGWSWTHWMVEPNRRYCELPFGHEGMHRVFEEDGSTLAAASAGYGHKGEAR